MNSRTTLTMAMVVTIAAIAFAQPADPVSGRWGSDGATFFDLSFDGKDVSGTVFWRAGGQAIRTPIRKGTYDPKTRAVRLESEGPRPDGTMRSCVIEGTVDGDTVSGRFSCGDASGDFKFARIKPAPGSRSPGEMQADFEARKSDFDYPARRLGVHGGKQRVRPVPWRLERRAPR